MNADRDAGGERENGEREGMVGHKLDTLSTSVAERFAAVDAALAGFRRHTESGFAAVDAAFVGVDAAFLEQRQYTEFAFDRLASEMRAGFDRVNSRFNRLERKLDRFIDTQSKANELVERRLRVLEQRSGWG